MKIIPNIKGFTMIEILVALAVLSVGLLGMAAMTVMVIRQSGGANDLQAATNICQLKLEELKDVQWELMGSINASGLTNSSTYGLDQGQVFKETQLNSRGKVCGSSGENETDCNHPTLGPYKYSRAYVICSGVDYNPDPPAGTEANLADNQDCATDDTHRTRWLACETTDITGTVGVDNPEKKIKVLCTWTSRDGQCHSVHLDTTAVKL